MRKTTQALFTMAIAVVTASSLLISGLPGTQVTQASSHREAPLISLDPTADGTDTYAFVSPDRPNSVTVLANFIPDENPASNQNSERRNFVTGIPAPQHKHAGKICLPKDSRVNIRPALRQHFGNCRFIRTKCVEETQILR